MIPHKKAEYMAAMHSISTIKIVLQSERVHIWYKFLILIYTHVTSRYFVRHKLDNQNKAQHERMVIPFVIVATLNWFSSLRPEG